MNNPLDAWARAGWIREVDRSLGRFVTTNAAQPSPLVDLAAALVSYQLGRGHPVLDLAVLLTDPDAVLGLPPDRDTESEPRRSNDLPRPSEVLDSISLDQWTTVLRASGIAEGDESNTPLALNGSRLQLRRYRQHELTLDSAIESRLRPWGAGLDHKDASLELRRTIDAVFDEDPRGSGDTDWQRLACALALRQRFAIITGGPGTGKTTTVIRLLAVMQSLALRGFTGRPLRPLRIGLTAPTGKSAARLNESIAGRLGALDLSRLPDSEAVRASIPTEVFTLHRLLGARSDDSGFRHDRTQPLPLDVLVIDEASMIDLALMSAACEALRPEASLILLGDKDQLASVEAGAVLGTLCARADTAHYTPSTKDWAHAASGESIPDRFVDQNGQARDQVIIKLRTSRRFSEDSGIGVLAQTVNAGAAEEARTLFRTGRKDLSLLEPLAAKAALTQAAAFHEYLSVMHSRAPVSGAPQAEWDHWAVEILKIFSRHRVLCALREGETGVSGVNQRITQALQADALINPSAEWFAGRPVMVTRNDMSLGLMNGDIGLALPSPRPSGGAGQGIRVAFPGDDRSGIVRWVLPARLRHVDTAFAMTVHKSQGSEFEHAALILPASWSPVLTRELIYTAVTRASHRFTLVEPQGSQSVFERAIQTPTRRLT